MKIRVNKSFCLFCKAVAKLSPDIGNLVMDILGYANYCSVAKLW